MPNPPFISLLANVDEELGRMSLREKIGQLLHIPAWSNRDEAHAKEVERLVREFNVGGIIFFQGHPLKQAELTNRFQAAARVPLMISIDGEWGLAMRLEETMAFPYAMTLGAIPDGQIGLIEEMGYEIGRQCRRLGIHVNFAPVADINTEPRNPVIGFRSFGADKEQVALRAAAYARGLQRAGTLAVAKHFPGHGDTTTDSHLTLPVVKHSRERLEAVELFPFQKLIAQGVGGVMPGHIHVPALDDRPHRGASLSAAITHQLLQEEMGFKGLIFTDALNMKGVSAHFEPGVLEVEALKAGNDVLLYCEHVHAAIEAIETAIVRGEISEQWINDRVRKQLAAKRWLGLPEEPVSLEGLMDDLHRPEAQTLNAELHQASLRIFNAYPHDLQRAGKVAALAFQAEPPLPFHEPLEGVDCLYWNPAVDQHWGRLMETLRGYDQVIISVHSDEMKAHKQFGLDEQVRARVREALASLPAMLVLFAHGYLFSELVQDEMIPAVQAWQNNRDAQRVAAGLF